MRIQPVILSGGSGTRLWPLSREHSPKQLLPLCGSRTMIQETALRVADGGAFLPPVVIGGDDQRFMIAEQMRAIGVAPKTLVIEPVGRNTAPAIAVAALLAEADDLLLVMPSDHTIRDVAAFRAAVATGAEVAAGGRLVTFGIIPQYPETGYGYIKRGQPLDQSGAFAVDRFVEKPEIETAKAYVASGEYSWNSGIFLFPAGTLLDEFGANTPDLLAGCRAAVDGGCADLFFFRLAAESFAAVPALSLDYAVMERTTKAAVVPVDMGWSDVGSWSALADQFPGDGDGNVLDGDVIAIDSRGSYLRSDSRLVAAIGIEDLVVVETPDAVLVARKDRAQDVRTVVDRLKAAGRPEFSTPKRTFRPWGWFETIDEGDRFKVKQIEVSPGAKLSLQRHQHRSEHWVVVRGTATVTCGEKTFMLHENESTFIPAGVVHRLENRGKISLNLIEVQSGAYVGEDDIERVEDTYGRV